MFFHAMLLDDIDDHIAMSFVVIFVGAKKIQAIRGYPGIIFLQRFPFLFHAFRSAAFKDQTGTDGDGPVALLHQGNIHFQRSANPGQRLIVEVFVSLYSYSDGKLHPEITMAGIFAAEQIFPFFFHHVFEKHSAQFGNRALLITNTEEAMDVAKFMKLILGPPLKLFSRQSTTEEKLPDWMRPGVSLLQSILKISNQILWTKYLRHKNLRFKGSL